MSQINLYCISLALILFPGFARAQEKPMPGNEAVFNFTITTISGKPRQGELVMVKSKKTKKIFQGNIGADGKLSIKVPVSDTYGVFYKLVTDTVKYKDLEVLAGDRGAIYTINLKHDPPRSFTLKNVFFETGLSTLKKESSQSLDELVDAMKSISTLVIEISGHTDSIGSPPSNLKLSADRANAVRNYLIKNGIDPKRVNSIGFGDTKPVASNETPEGRQKNRRTEVRIISE